MSPCCSCPPVAMPMRVQIFSPQFCADNWQRTINIHHSFLPAFEVRPPEEGRGGEAEEKEGVGGGGKGS